MDNTAKAGNYGESQNPRPVELQNLKQLQSSINCVGYGSEKPWLMNKPVGSILSNVGVVDNKPNYLPTKHVAFSDMTNGQQSFMPEPSEEPQLARQKGSERLRPGRRSLTLQDDISKLQSSYESLQSQWQQRNSRKEFASIEEDRPLTTTSAYSLGGGMVPTATAAVKFGPTASSGNDCILGTKDIKEMFQFPVATNSKARDNAADVFEDAELVKLCEEGLNKQLQRTKDGATEQSRIQELAGDA